jgi:pimeloyl-ACP methyl ester carboxylesterase
LSKGFCHYQSSGSGWDIVVIPGFWTNSDWIRKYFDLTDIGKIWIIDPPYSNLSDCKTKSTVESYAKTIKETLEKLGIKEPVIIGESLGVATALELEKQIGVSKMILISPATGISLGLLVSGMLQMLLPFGSVVKARASMMLKRKPEMIPEAVSMMSGFPKSKLINAMIALWRYKPVYQKLGTKTLIISGKFDKFGSPEKMKEISKKLGARLVINETSGHHVTEYAWPDVSKTIRNFLTD